MPRHRSFRAVVPALAIVLLAIALLHASASLTTASLLFILAIVVTATLVGRGAALIAALVALLLLNLLFIPPLYTLRITAQEDIAAFAVFAITALLVGHLSSSLRRRAEEAEHQRAHLEQVNEQLRSASRLAAESEMLRRSEHLKSAILDAVTHDLKTPLTSIKAAATTLLGGIEKDFPASQRTRAFDLLNVINEESDRLDKFIGEMVTFARFQDATILRDEQPVTLQEICEVALERAAGLLARHRLEVNVPPELPALAVDARAISEVIYNLLENACKYSDPYSFIHLQAQRREENEVEVTIEDEGCGIPEPMREQIFERFFRHGEKQGHGMGLAIARGLVEAHGGRIWAEGRRAGRGTAFIFRLPIHVAGPQLTGGAGA